MNPKTRLFDSPAPFISHDEPKLSALEPVEIVFYFVIAVAFGRSKGYRSEWLLDISIVCGIWTFVFNFVHAIFDCVSARIRGRSWPFEVTFARCLRGAFILFFLSRVYSYVGGR